MVYPVIRLPDDAPTQLEQLGTKAKFWYRGQNDRRMLFKKGRPGTGENWAEKVCCEIARLLNIPHAEYDLAVWRDSKGVVSPSFVPSGARLVFGNELLGKLINDYKEGGKRYQARQHTVGRVMAVTSSKAVRLPLEWGAPDSITLAADVFIGYLMLDALIGNQDRHDENWGLISLPDKRVFLTPTFDHASSLGRNEHDDARQRMLTTRDKNQTVEAYVGRARSALYATPTSTKPLTTLDAFREAVKILPRAADYWKALLDGIDVEEFRAILREVPDTEITNPAREFAYRMLEINIGRILG